MAVASSFKQQCPTCEAMISVKESMIGKKVECTKCKDKFIAKKPVEEEVEVEVEPEDDDDLPAKKKSKPAGKKSTGTTAKAPPGKRPKLEVDDDEDDDAPPKSKNKPSSNGKSRKAQDDDDDEDDDEDEDSGKKKKKAAGGSNRLVIGLSLAGVGVLVLGIAAFFILRNPSNPTPRPGGGNANNQQNEETPEIKTPPRPINVTPPPPTVIALNDAEIARVTNLLPNESEHVFSIAFANMFAPGSTLRNAVFDTPGAFDDADLKKKLGFSVLGIDHMVCAEKYTFPGWRYTVIRFKDIVNESDLKAALKLESAGSAIEGQSYFKIGKTQTVFDQLARFSFGIPNYYRFFEARSDRPTYVRLHNPQTLIVGDQEPVQALLRAKGQFAYQTQRQPSVPDPGKNSPPGGMNGGTPMPPGGDPNPKVPPTGDKIGAAPMRRAEFVAYTNDQEQPPPQAGGGAQQKPLIDKTTWDGTEGPDKEPLKFIFGEDGNVQVESNKAGAGMAKWRSTSGTPSAFNIEITMVDGGTVYTGMVDINKKEMSGNAKKDADQWNFSAKLTAGGPTTPGPGTNPTPGGGGGGPRDDMYLTIKPSLKAMLDRMEIRGSDKEKLLFSSATDMDANTLPQKDAAFKNTVIRAPRQFWDVTLLLRESKPRIRHLGTSLIQRDMLKYQLRNELSCAQEIDAKEFSKELMDQTSYTVAKFIFQLTKHEVKLPSPIVEKKDPAPNPEPPPPPPPGGEQEPKKEDPKPKEAEVSQITIKQQQTTVEFVLDLLLDNQTLDQARGIASLAASTLRYEINAAANVSLRHTLAIAGRQSGEKGLPDRQIEAATFPPGAFERTNTTLHTDREPRNRISWMAALLPYLGHKNLYAKINFEQSWRDPSNWLAGNSSVPQFLDPSYPRSARQASVGDLPLDFAATHYVGIAGVGMDAASYRRGDPATAHKRGVLSYNGSAALSEVLAGRGTANTILMIQIPHDRGTGVGPWIAGGGATLRGVPEKNSVQPFVLSKGQHQGKIGTYALMTDGSVRFIDQNVSDDVFKAMATIGGPAPEDFDLNKNPLTPLIPHPDAKPAPSKVAPKKPAEKPAPPKVEPKADPVQKVDPKTEPTPKKGEGKVDPKTEPAPKKVDGKTATQGAVKANTVLGGQWIGKTMEIDGKALPPDAAKRMVFHFKDDRVLIRGNFKNDKEEDCSYTLNTRSTPHQLDLTLPGESKSVLGIVEIGKNDELKICFRQAAGTDGRPTAFGTRPGSQAIEIVLTRQDP